MHSTSAPATSEPIPGYQLEERLGRGGYGEVWKARAPGALLKAVKLVHGYHEEELARRELHALERIKEVRHPFLISIERIEVCDGQLVIVTELADMSLRDRFNECREQGQIGLPRDELLAHLRDVADALDYMSERHSLQHLDVKPENLMLVGDRLKVGDFGLVKDLQQVTASLMSTLTPVYAAPELFDGRPHCHSDQYSLAIVYQEMLTGRRPFRGATAAQLTSQHLQDPPDLDSVPVSDREILAKALAKNPDLRFGSCREFVDRLLEAGADKDHRQAAATSNVDTALDEAVGKTIVESPSLKQRADVSGDSSGADGVGATANLCANRVVDLPRVEAREDNFGLRPTLVVGIGGVGARAIHKFNRRLSDRFGARDSLGVFRSLYLDTDLKAIASATQRDAAESLDPQETLAMPLRRTQSYGVEKTKFLRWMSRRWLYNIPRSLNTEGRRPLGRVALIDHLGELFERLGSLVAEMTSAATLSAAHQATGCEFTDAPPRVFIVSSLCGGTGGGMVLDVAYAVRQALREQGCRDDGVYGLLAYSTPRDPEAQQLAKANAYATLAELNHYASPGKVYPGATDCGLAATGADDVTFPSVGFLNMGDGLTEERFDESAEQLAEYMYLDATSSCAAVFDAIHDTARHTVPLDPAIVPLRSFGLHPRGGLRADIFDDAGGGLCRDLVTRWLGTARAIQVAVDESASSDDEGVSTVSDEASETEAVDGSNDPAGASATDEADDAASLFVQQETEALSTDDLLARLEEAATERLGKTPEAFIADVCCGSSIEAAVEKIDQATRLTEMNTSTITVPGQPEIEVEPSLADVLIDHAKQIGDEHGRALNGRILQLVDHPDVRVRGAYWAASTLRIAVEASRRQADKLLTDKQAQIEKLRYTCLASNQGRKNRTIADGRRDDQSTSTEGALREYLLARLSGVAVLGVQKMLRSAEGSVMRGLQGISSLTRSLEILSDKLPSAEGTRQRRPESELDLDTHINTLVQRSLDERHDELVEQLDERVCAKWLNERGGLASLLDGGPNMEAELAAQIAGQARAAVVGAVKQIDLAGEIVSLAAADEEGRTSFAMWLEEAQAAALGAGGARTFVVAVGPDTDSAAIQQLIESETDGHCTVARHPDSTFGLVCVGEQLSLANVARRLVRGTNIAEIANRLHTRIDVQWTPIS